MLAVGALPYLWRQSGWLLIVGQDALLQPGSSSRLSGRSEEVAQSILFVLCVLSLSWVQDLPWTLYYTFRLEERHGFNKQTLGLFVSDFVKQVCVWGGGGGPLCI